MIDDGRRRDGYMYRDRPRMTDNHMDGSSLESDRSGPSTMVRPEEVGEV